MFRKLLLFVVMAFALSATPAAAVFVEEDGMQYIQAENTIALGFHQPTMGFVPTSFCFGEAEVDVTSAGHLNINDIETHSHTGDSGLNCENANDCNDAGWEGQIVEGGLGEFTSHVTACVEGGGSHLDGEPHTLECPISGGETHCDWEIGTLEAPNPPFMLEVVGEAFAESDAGLMHEEP